MPRVDGSLRFLKHSVVIFVVVMIIVVGWAALTYRDLDSPRTDNQISASYTRGADRCSQILSHRPLASGITRAEADVLLEESRTDAMRNGRNADDQEAGCRRAIETRHGDIGSLPPS